MIKKSSLSLVVVGMMLLVSIPLKAVGLERLNDEDFYFPNQAAFNASTAGATYVDIGTQGVEEMEVFNSVGVNNGDGLDGSLEVRVSTELDLTNFSARYASNNNTPTFNTAVNEIANTDAIVVKDAEVLNGVTVQQKFRIFDPGNVVRVEVLLTSTTDTTREIRVDGNFGSDEDTVLMAQRSTATTSVGDWSGGITEIADNLMTSTTQWFITAEDSVVSTASRDPLMGTVLRGPVSTVNYEWVEIPGTANEEDDWGVDYTVVLPANQTVSLVLFHHAMPHNGDVTNGNFGNYTSLMNNFNSYSGAYFANLTPNVPVLNWGDSPSNRTVFYPLDEKTVKKVGPSAPSTPVVKLIGKSSASIKLMRPTSNGTGTLTKFNIYRNGRLIASVPASKTSYVDRNLERGSSYSYQIQAISTDGQSQKSKVSISIYRR